MWKPIAWWRAGRSRARTDAADMILRYGDRAAGVADKLSRAERRGRVVDVLLPPGHWERVARGIRRRARRNPERSG